jgi:hypothetical protein
VVSNDQPEAREGQAGRLGVAERFVVPLKPGNSGGGKGPRFKTDAIRREGRGRSDVEEFAGSRDVLGAVGVGKEPVVADAMEAFGQHVDQEAADELSPTLSVIVVYRPGPSIL